MVSAQNPSLELISDDPAGGAPWETVPANEAEAIRAIAREIEAGVRKAAETGPARRDAHPKSHGCVEAEFRVLGDHDAPKAGLFEKARSYQAWIRFSNAKEKVQEDATKDGRGMAVKVMGVEGSRSATQDFILINSPTFFVRNAADFVPFTTAPSPARFFFPGLNPFKYRLYEFGRALRIAGGTVSNPLNIAYWSMTPYLFGAEPCKFSARPAGLASPFEDRSTPDFLHDNLVKALQAGDAAFDFCVQLRNDPNTMPIEDPTIEWSETASEPIKVARITIPRQRFDTPERIALGENLSFTPWHGLDAHRPLGGINRARRTVYETISRLRHELNGVERAEPRSVSASS